MKKLLLLSLTCLIGFCSFAQDPFMAHKLYYTCKVWGFVKYYHSNVSTCNVNWDSVLVSVLPAIRTAASDSEFNDALDSMLAAAGPMTIATTPFPDVIPPELKRNRDFSWMGAPMLRSDVQVQLDTIRHNFRPHAICWVGNNTSGTGGYLMFPHDSAGISANTATAYPDQDTRLLMLYKYWNIIRYFNPYNYALDVSWDSTLMHFAVPVTLAPNGQELTKLYMRIATNLNDAHVYGLTYSSEYQQLPGFYKPYIRMVYTGGQYVVVKSEVTGINEGDAILSVDGRTTAQWEDSLRQFYSSGNSSVFRRSMCSNLLGRMTNGTAENITVEDSTGTIHTVLAHCVWWPATSFFDGYYYPADSLNNINWTTMDCGIGYLNVGNLTEAGTDSAYDALQNAPALIIDIRNYPISSSVWELADRMYATPTEFSKLTIPDVTYPGTYTWYHDNMGIGTGTPYAGKIIILMNEQTQSAAEFDCMVLSAMPDVVKIGSQTAGADGNVTYWKASQDIYVGYTNLGVYYPNGDSTQRIGIVPDSVVYPSRTGIRLHNDEVLNKALEIACAVSSVKTINDSKTKVTIAPNPAYDVINAEVHNAPIGKVSFELTDITGRVLAEKTIKARGGDVYTSFDVAAFTPGMYLLVTKAGEQQFTTKVVKR